MIRSGCVALLVLLAFGTNPGAAQSGADSGCILDHCADRKPLPPPASRAPAAPTAAPAGQTYDRTPAPAGNFDFYVLSLSWSAGFCATTWTQADSAQCQPGSELGFVVHGLWPQFEQGFPSNCDASVRSPSRQALDSAAGLFPAEGLARHEWQTHGTCSGLAPADYFASVRRARDSVHVPDDIERLAASGEAASPNDVMRAFQSANPRLRPGMMAVGCARGVLQEVRICMTKDLRDFRPCPEVVRGSCRSRQISIPPAL